MFTGIVEELGIIKNIINKGSSAEIYIKCREVLKETKIGDSISVNGICLTVSQIYDTYFAADVMPETMRKTTLSFLNSNDKVNLERALRLSDRLGGHIVSGHIDGVGTIANRILESDSIWLTINSTSEILRYIIFKGSIAVDGVSLTVAYVDDCQFKVSLIPVTAQKTILGLKRIGDKVNLECDALGKYVEKFTMSKEMQPDKKSKITENFLKYNGFL